MLLLCASRTIAQSWFFEGYQSSNPSSGLCPSNPVTEGSGSNTFPCTSEPEGFNCIQYDGALVWDIVMYTSEDCSGAGTTRGAGATGNLAFFSTFHSWQIVRA